MAGGLVVELLLYFVHSLGRRRSSQAVGTTPEEAWGVDPSTQKKLPSTSGNGTTPEIPSDDALETPSFYDFLTTPRNDTLAS